MILIGIGRYRWYWIAGEYLALLLLSAACALWMYAGLGEPPLNILTYAIRIFLVLAFLWLGRRDIVKLFRRPAKNMGTGLSRVWSVGRVTLLEAWAGRIWLLPVLWFLASIILINSVRPFDESERIPLYIRMLLASQEVLLLVMIWVMACVSLPRDRERKTIATNASKPLSRLEMVLGKMVGFGTAAGAALVVMGILSLAILYVSDFNQKNRAREAYELQKRDFAKNLKAPSESLKLLSEQGSLYAYNYIAVPKDNMSIVGMMDNSVSPPERYLKGGSYEKAIYRFAPRLNASVTAQIAPVGTRPYFVFYFPQYPPLASDNPIQIRVSAISTSPFLTAPPRPVEKTLTLNAQGVAAWEPDDTDELYSYSDATSLLNDRGEVSVEVSCLTPGVLLRIFDGGVPDEKGQLPAGTDMNVAFVPIRNQPTLQIPLPRPVVRGFERRNRQEVAGPTKADAALGPKAMLEYAIYRFPAESLRHVPVDEKGNFTLALNLETYKMDNTDMPTIAGMDVFSLDNRGEVPFKTKFEVREKRLTMIPVPRSCLGDSDPDKRGDMIVRLYCWTPPGHSISMLEDSVRIEKPQTPFAINLFKSEAVIFLESLLIIAVAVACSIRLGWPVAMFCSFVCFIFGYFETWIKGLQEYGGLAALNYNLSYTGKTGLLAFFDLTTGMLWKVLAVIASFVPDFSVYQPQEFIPTLHNMPWAVLASNTLDTCIYLLPIIAISYLLIRRQEFG